MLTLCSCAGRQKAKVKSKSKPKSGGRQSKSAASTGSVQPAHKPVDYSRFDTIEVSDEDEDLHKVGNFYEGRAEDHTVSTFSPCLLLSGIHMLTLMRGKASLAATVLLETCRVTGILRCISLSCARSFVTTLSLQQ